MRMHARKRFAGLSLGALAGGGAVLLVLSLGHEGLFGPLKHCREEPKAMATGGWRQGGGGGSMRMMMVMVVVVVVRCTG